MTELTATPDTTAGRVRLVYSDAQGGTLTRNGQQVRGGAAVTGYGIIDDYEAEFGVDLVYSLDGVTDTVVFTPVDTAWLSHPFDPSLTLPVTVVDDNPFEWSTSGSVLTPIASSWPIAIHSARTVHRGELVVFTPWDARDQMKALTASGSPLLLRSTPDCRVDDVWLYAETITREKATPTTDRLRWTLRYQRVGRPVGETVAVPANAWSAVVQTHPTWADLVAGHATWGDTLTTPHPHA